MNHMPPTVDLPAEVVALTARLDAADSERAELAAQVAELHSRRDQDLQALREVFTLMVDLVHSYGLAPSSRDEQLQEIMGSPAYQAVAARLGLDGGASTVGEGGDDVVPVGGVPHGVVSPGQGQQDAPRGLLR
jgi:hypothetical protein